MKKIGLETFLGGLFGIIAIVATLAEFAINGEITSDSILSVMKDIAGTMVAVMVFVIAAKSLLPKKTEDFIGVFENEMKKIETKYSPLLRRAEANGDKKRENKFTNVIRFELSTNIDAIIDGSAKSFAKFFEFNIKKTENISFEINKTTFMGRSTENFDDMKEMLTYKMISCLVRKFPDFGKGIVKTDKGFEINFESVLGTRDDAIMLAELVDCVTLLYIAGCKK